MSKAQERLTDIQEGNATQVDFHYTWQGKEYILNTFGGYLNLYEWTGGNTKLISEIGSIMQYYGYRDFGRPLFKNQYLVIQNYEDFLVYDLDTHQYKKYPKIKGFINYNYEIVDDNYAILSSNSIEGPYKKYFKLNYTNGLIATDGSLGSIVAAHGDYMVYHGWADESHVNNKYTLIDQRTGESIILVNGTSRSLNFDFEDTRIWFYNEKGIATSYDVIKKEFLQYSELQIVTGLSKYKLHRQDSLLISVAVGNLKNSFAVYNINQSKIVNSYYEGSPSTHQINIENVHFFEHKVVVNTYYTNLIAYEYLSGEITRYEASIDFDLEAHVGDLRLEKRSIQYKNEKLRLIDLDTKEVIYFDYLPPQNGQSNYRSLSYTNSHILEETDDYILVTFSGVYNINHYNQLKIFKKSKKVEELNFFKRNAGLGSDSYLLASSYHIYLIGENIYQLKGRTRMQVNQLPLHPHSINGNQPYLEENGDLIYFCKEGNNVTAHSYDGCESKEVGRMVLPSNFTKWIFKDNRFFYISQSELYVVYRGSIKSLGPMNTSFSENLLGSYGNFYFYYNKRVFYYSEPVVREVGEVEGNITGFFEYGGAVFTKGFNSYRVSPSGLTLIKNSTGNYFYKSIQSLLDNGKFVLGVKGCGYIKGSEYYPITEDSAIFVQKEKTMVLMRKKGRAYIIDLDDYTKYDLPTLQNGRYIGISVVGPDTLIYSIENFTTLMKVYKWSDKSICEFKLSYEYNYYQDYMFVAEGFDKVKVLLLGNEYYLINKKSEVHKLNILKFPFINTTNYFAKFFMQKFYYFDYDKTYGKQVYRYDLSDEIYTKTNPKQIQVELKYNSVRDKIEVISNDTPDIDFDYNIYTVSGMLLHNGRLNNEALDVSNLTTGIYYLQLFTQSGQKALPFFKY